MKDDIGKFINILYLTEDKKYIIAKILIFIGIHYNKEHGFKFIQPGGRVLNSYKSKELKINMIKNKIKLLKKDKIKNKEKIIKQNKIIEDIKNKIKIEKEKAKLKNKQKI